MKHYRIASTTGGTFYRCGIPFTAEARTVTVGDGGDVSEEGFKSILRAEEGRALSVTEVSGSAAKPVKSDEGEASPVKPDDKAPTTRNRSKR